MKKLFAYKTPDLAPNRLSLNVLCACTVCAVAVHFAILPIWLLLLTLSLIVWKLTIENHGWPRPNRLVLFVALLLAMALVFYQFKTLLGQEAGVSLLSLLAGLKLLESRSQRDFTVNMVLVLFLTVSLFLFDQSLWTLLFAMTVCFLSVWCLSLSCQKKPVLQKSEFKRLAGLLLTALPVMMLCYVLFPRIQGSLWALPSSSSTGVSGIADSVRPGSISDLVKNEAVAFRAEFPAAIPRQEELYWRVLVLDRYVDGHWSKSKSRYRNPFISAYTTNRQRLIPYTITLEPHKKQWLPLLDWPAELPFNSEIDRNATVTLNRKVETVQRFKAASSPEIEWRVYPGSQPKVLARLPEMSPRVAALLDQFKRQSATAEGLAAAILDYFASEDFVYTLQPPAIDGPFLDQFLFDTKRGFCEHYASALVSLLQHAGVPSRLVGGYLGAEYNDAGNYYIVRQSDAHVWAEIWIDQQGWKRIDPTEAIAPERIELGIGAIQEMEDQGLDIGELSAEEVIEHIQNIREWRKYWHRMILYWDMVNLRWDKFILDYTPKKQRELMQRIGFEKPDWFNLVMLLAGSVLLSVLIIAIYLFRPASKKDPVIKTYNKFCRKMAHLGVVRRDNEGPLDFKSRCLLSRPSQLNDINRIFNDYILIRYAGIENKQLFQQFHSKVRKFKPV